MRNAALVLGAVALCTGSHAVPAAGAGRAAADAGLLPCDVNFRLRNDLSHSVTVYWEKSQVRTRFGIWTRIGDGNTGVSGGTTRTISHQVKLGCNAHRRYRLLITSGQHGSVFHYLPGEKSFTQDNDLTVRMSDAF